jgi:DNA-binding transcriptional LysR family regulator
MHRPGIMNWDDLRFVLAVAETGSVSAAARAPGVNHATVLRRIAAYEDAAGGPVFDRGATGYTVAAGRQRVIEAARDAALAMDTVARTLQAATGGADQPVRVTSTDTFCQFVLPDILASLPQGTEWPQVELFCSNAHTDLGRSGADITVRPALRLPPDLRGEEAGRLTFAVYARPDAADLWLGLRGVLVRTFAAQWMADNLPPDAVIGGADSFVVLHQMALRGMGRAVLPRIVGDNDPRLQRTTTALPMSDVPIWVASHTDMADAPRLVRVRRALADGLRTQQARLG